MPGAAHDVCFEAIQQRPRSCALLVGAGCSASAGVLLASGLIADLKKKYEARLRGFRSESYAEAMAFLTEDEFWQFAVDHIRKAKVNLEHLCIALLMKERVFDRVLTTSFDPLIAHACVLTATDYGLGDCASMDDIQRSREDLRPIIYHLHGQACGLRMLNTTAETASRSGQVQEAIRSTVHRRILVVCGYSGKSDDIPTEMRNNFGPHLRNPIFWVPHTDGEGELVAKQFHERPKPVFVLKPAWAEVFLFNLLARTAPSAMELLEGTIAAQESRLASMPTELPDWFRSRHAEKSAPSSREIDLPRSREGDSDA